jgi:cell division cycle 20-like protein 1 (cofactor of APC complex)
LFSKQNNSIITSHGFQENDVNIWSLKNYEKISCLKGHTNRVLFMAMNNDGSQLVTGAGDETLRFWDISDKEIKPKC